MNSLSYKNYNRSNEELYCINAYQLLMREFLVVFSLFLFNVFVMLSLLLWCTFCLMRWQ